MSDSSFQTVTISKEAKNAEEQKQSHRSNRLACVHQDVAGVRGRGDPIAWDHHRELLVSSALSEEETKRIRKGEINDELAQDCLPADEQSSQALHI